MYPHFEKYEVAHREACVEIFRSNVPIYFRDHEFGDFLGFIDNSSGPYFVVTTNGDAANGEIVACGGFGVRTGSEVADLCWGMVDAAHHRNGLGEFLLLARMYQILKEPGVRHIRLGTCQLTEGFFHRYGFETRNSVPDAEGLDDVQMWMELTDENRRLIDSRWAETSNDI